MPEEKEKRRTQSKKVKGDEKKIESDYRTDNEQVKKKHGDHEKKEKSKESGKKKPQKSLSTAERRKRIKKARRLSTERKRLRRDSSLTDDDRDRIDRKRRQHKRKRKFKERKTKDKKIHSPAQEKRGEKLVKEICNWTSVLSWPSKNAFLGPLMFLVFLAVYTTLCGVAMWFTERHFAPLGYNATDPDDALEALWTNRTDDRDGWKSEVLEFYQDKLHHDDEHPWSLYDGIFYCFCLCTASTGYHALPRTCGGKVFTVIYAMIAIPLTIMAADECIKLITETLKIFFQKVHCWCCALSCLFTGDPLRRKGYMPVKKDRSVSLPFSLVMFFLYVYVGSSYLLARWQFGVFETMYQSFLAFTTIDVGRAFYLASSSAGFLAFNLVYIMFGIALVDICCEGIGKKMKERFLVFDPAKHHILSTESCCVSSKSDEE